MDSEVEVNPAGTSTRAPSARKRLPHPRATRTAARDRVPERRPRLVRRSNGLRGVHLEVNRQTSWAPASRLPAALLVLLLPALPPP